MFGSSAGAAAVKVDPFSVTLEGTQFLWRLPKSELQKRQVPCDRACAGVNVDASGASRRVTHIHCIV